MKKQKYDETREIVYTFEIDIVEHTFDYLKIPQPSSEEMLELLNRAIDWRGEEFFGILSDWLKETIEEEYQKE